MRVVYLKQIISFAHLLHNGGQRRHVVLKQLSAAYLAWRTENADQLKPIFHAKNVGVGKGCRHCGQVRERNDLFEINNAHWQMFWESVNASLLASVESLLLDLDTLVLPEKQTDDLEEALKFYDASRQRIQKFLQNHEKQTATEPIPSRLHLSPKRNLPIAKSNSRHCQNI